MLHIVNKSPTENTSLDSCLRVAGAGNALLLIEDAVYAATKGSPGESKIRNAIPSLKVYALAPDLEARGMTGALTEGVELVNYGGFVELVAQHRAVHSWL